MQIYIYIPSHEFPQIGVQVHIPNTYMEIGEMRNYYKFIRLKQYPCLRSHSIGQKMAHMILSSELHQGKSGYQLDDVVV